VTDKGIILVANNIIVTKYIALCFHMFLLRMRNLGYIIIIIVVVIIIIILSGAAFSL